MTDEPSISAVAHFTVSRAGVSDTGTNTSLLQTAVVALLFFMPVNIEHIWRHIWLYVTISCLLLLYGRSKCGET